jgi:hypothetical protein
VKLIFLSSIFFLFYLFTAFCDEPLVKIENEVIIFDCETTGLYFDIANISGKEVFFFPEGILSEIKILDNVYYLDINVDSERKVNWISYSGVNFPTTIRLKPFERYRYKTEYTRYVQGPQEGLPEVTELWVVITFISQQFEDIRTYEEYITILKEYGKRVLIRKSDVTVRQVHEHNWEFAPESVEPDAPR